MSDIYLSLTETPTVVTLSQPVIASSVAATVTVGNTVTVALDANSLSALENVTVTVGAAVSVSNFPSTQTIAGTVTAKIDGIDPTVIGSGGSIIQDIPGPDVNSIRTVLWSVDTNSDIGAEVGPSNPLPISGTVTVGALNVWDEGNDEYSAVRGLSVGSFGSAMQVIGGDETNLINGRPSLPVAGTVTVSTLPSGALTTRFGSVTTASVAQLTSCVTNTSRKYLLAQNISAGTVTIGIGFSPTTTQGIQLTAGAGLTFDSFCPTGAVFWLGAVTGAAFTILEG